MKTRITTGTATLVVILIFSNSLYAKKCSELWTESMVLHGKYLYSAGEAISRIVSRPFVTTPKALRLSEGVHYPLVFTSDMVKKAEKVRDTKLVFPKLKTFRYRAWVILISESCDRDLIKNLDRANRNALGQLSLDKYLLSTRFRMNLGNVPFSHFIKTFRLGCKAPVSVSRRLNRLPIIWLLISNKDISCNEMFSLFAIHGMKVEFSKGKLITDVAHR